MLFLQHSKSKVTFWRGKYHNVSSIHVQALCGPAIDKDPIDVESKPFAQLALRDDGGRREIWVVEGGAYGRSSSNIIFLAKLKYQKLLLVNF